MVYDVSRNYIGDMHWRENEILQDGDEFKLDRGVLIQVGEATGSIEQDLTGLFEKRKKAPGVVVNEEVSHQPAAVSTARPTAAQPSQLRPKTLNALLGTPKGRIGRAALPTKSPHELRTENENSSWNHDRPPKRQRIELQSEKSAKLNTPPAPRTPATFMAPDDRVDKAVAGAVIDKQLEENCVPTTVRNPGLSSAGNAINRPINPLTPRSKNDKDDKASKRLVEALPKKRLSGSRSLESSERQRKRKPDQDAQGSPKVKKTASRLAHESETGYSRTSTITKPIEIDGDEDTTSTNKQSKQRSKLQMASRKPRKKLMYRDLLPQESSGTGRSSGDASVIDRTSRDRSTSSRPDVQRKYPMAEFHKEEQNRLKARLTRHDAQEMHRESEREEFCGEAPEDLFLSQEDVASTATNYDRTKEKESVPSSCMAGSCRRNTEHVPSSTRRSSSPEVLLKVIPGSPATIYSTAMTLGKMDAIVISRSQPRISDEAVEDKDVSSEVLTQEFSPPPIPKSTPDVVSTPSPSKDRPDSSPSFQTQAHVPSLKLLPSEAPFGTSILSRPSPDPLCTFQKVVQPKAQRPKGKDSNFPPPDPQLSSHLPTQPSATVFARSPPKDRPVVAPSLQAQPNIRPPKSPSPEPPIAAVAPPIPSLKPNALPAFTNAVSPKPPPAVEPPPRSKPDKQPASTKIVPVAPVSKPSDKTVEVLSSQPSTPPPEAPITAPHPPKRKPDSLPAFTKVVPMKVRSPLKKAMSDTSAMRPPSGVPALDRKENTLLENPGGKEEVASLWSAEAWDLFGCGRDGVECTYEEFKRKEGLL